MVKRGLIDAPFSAAALDRFFSGLQPSSFADLRPGLPRTLPRAREHAQRCGGREPEKAGATHAEFGGASVVPASGWQQVTRLYRDQEIPEERCWLRGPGWCLATS